MYRLTNNVIKGGEKNEKTIEEVYDELSEENKKIILSYAYGIMLGQEYKEGGEKNCIG